MTQFKDTFWGFNGFEELNKYMKESTDFSKSVASCLHERAELECQYAKGLQKLAAKLNKSASTVIGTTGAVWQRVADVMKEEGEHHKDLSLSLIEDVFKPLKAMCDSQNKKRKTIECPVDKSWKHLSDCRNEEQKFRKQSLSNNKEYERLVEQIADSRLNRIKGLTLKEVAKLETKRRKWEEQSLHTDVDYFAACLKSERWRQQCSIRVETASEQFEQLEKERLEQMQDFAQKFTNHLTLLGPKRVQSCEKLSETIEFLDPDGDLRTVIEMKGKGPAVEEQILPDFYAEDSSSGLKKERRKEALERYLQMIQHDLETEKQSMTGVQSLSNAYKPTSKFCDTGSNQNVDNTLHQIQSMVNFLEVCQYKVLCALADVKNCNRPTNHLSAYLEQQRNKQGMQSILRIPSWVEATPEIGNVIAATGVESSRSNPDLALSRCRALYAYEATAEDELTLQPGESREQLSRPRIGNRSICVCGTLLRCKERARIGGRAS